MLKEPPLYSILSGFSFGDTPGFGTFYDFFSRIWQHDSRHFSPKDRFPKMKPSKGKKKGDKTPCDSSSVAYDGRTSVERSNKREKEDYKLEDGRHRSTKMWYCRLYSIMMLQHLDAWEMSSVEAFQESLLSLAS